MPIHQAATSTASTSSGSPTASNWWRCQPAQSRLTSCTNWDLAHCPVTSTSWPYFASAFLVPSALLIACWVVVCYCHLRSTRAAREASWAEQPLTLGATASARLENPPPEGGLITTVPVFNMTESGRVQYQPVARQDTVFEVPPGLAEWVVFVSMWQGADWLACCCCCCWSTELTQELRSNSGRHVDSWHPAMP